VDVVAALQSGLQSALGTQAAVYALLAIGLNVHYGYTGLLNFGQAGFMLVGAYGVGISIATWGLSIWAAVFMGLVASVALALLLGAPTLRLRSDYFAITTIAVAEVLRLVANSAPAGPITGGPLGLQFSSPFYRVNPFESGLDLGVISYPVNTTWAMLVTWGLVGLATLVVALLMRSPWGRVIRSIREDEEAARSLGKNVFSYKMQSLVLGGVIGGVGGIMWAIVGNTVNANTFRPQATFFAYAILILGGAASRIGPIVGSMLFWFVLATGQSVVRQAGSAGYIPGGLAGPTALILTGLGLMLLVVYRPQGIFGNTRELSLDG
jgi:neutral amino acid transport system permease protein